MSNPKKRAILSLLLLTAAVLTVGLSLSFAQENGDDADEAASEGAVLYQSFCAACHMTDGSGAEGAGTYPNLADNNAVEARSEEHTSELQSRFDLVCRLLLEKK